jgi:molybdate transport system ATP-binding protein
MSASLDIAIDHTGEDGFSLRLEAAVPGTGISALFGPSGSGKTTVLDTVAGLRPDIDRARISFAGECWQAEGTRLPPWARRVAYVFQEPRLFPHLSVQGNLEYARSRARTAPPPLAEIVDALEIGSLLPRQPQTLSAGQGQRVAIARALLGAPRLLLLDEPLANLDRAAAAHCLRCLVRVAGERTLPMLYVSHRIEEVAAIAEHLLLLRDGRLEAAGPTAELLSRLDQRLAEDETAAAILLGEVMGRDDFGLLRLRAEGETLYVGGEATVGSRQRLRIAARDVSVCRERPSQSSILNILPVTLEDLRSISHTHCLLRLRLGGQHLLARITERSRHQLALTPGDALYAQIKSSALVKPGGEA